jgi:hypothetical protein
LGAAVESPRMTILWIVLIVLLVLVVLGYFGRGRYGSR